MQGKVVFCKTFGSQGLVVRDSYADIPGIDTSWIQRLGITINFIDGPTPEGE